MERQLMNNKKKIVDLEQWLDRIEKNSTEGSKDLDSEQQGKGNDKRNLIVLNGGGEITEQRKVGEDIRKDNTIEEELDKNSEGTEVKKIIAGKTGRDMIKSMIYLKEMPDALGKGEYKYEIIEREKRKKSIMIKGIRTVG